MFNIEEVPFKYVIEYKDSDPLHLLFQIVSWLKLCGRDTAQFTISEVNMHTVVREDGKALPLIEKLMELGHVKRIKGVQYCVMSTPWS
jgi:hypothetical protein